METARNTEQQTSASGLRKKLLADLPVKEKQVFAAKISTTYLEGGHGRTLVLLHGPGESSLWWMNVIPFLVKDFKIIAPDLPGHGSSGRAGEKLSKKILVNWLHDFLSKTCNQRPILIGHIVGGSLAADYASMHSEKLKQLILVDTLGLSSFRPAPKFAFEFLRFVISPTRKSYLRFLPQCLYNMNEVSNTMGEYWQPFIDYNLVCANIPEKKKAAKDIMSALSGKIPEDQLEKITIPVSLIWGRYDKANRLRVAVRASETYGWPLHIIEDTRDDPKLEKPEAFVEAVRSFITEPVPGGVGVN